MRKFQRRSVAEWSFETGRVYESPFADVQVDMTFTAPSGAVQVMPGFHDGGNIWKVRFNPGEAGRYSATLSSRPVNPDFQVSFEFEVEDAQSEGFLTTCPGKAFGFKYENGDPVFISGDTTYDLFGMQYCGGNVEGFVKRRKSQGFNLVRTRLHVSYFHPPARNFEWQTKRMWPWGGSNTAPRFDQFNLDWSRSVDASVSMIEEIGSLGLSLEGRAEWFDPRTGVRPEAVAVNGVYTVPEGRGEGGHPQDYALIGDMQ